MHKMYVLVKVLVMLTEMIDVSDVFFFFLCKIFYKISTLSTNVSTVYFIKKTTHISLSNSLFYAKRFI